LVDRFSTYLPLVILFGGLALSLLSFFLMHFGVTALYRSKELAEVNESLEKKVAERTKELSERDKFTRQWLSNCTDGAWYWDLEKNTVYMTPQFKSLLGYGESEIDDSVETWRRLVPPMDLQVADRAYNDYINAGKLYTYQLRWMHKDGHMVWTLCRGEGIKDDSGKIVQMVGTLTDISKLKKLEEELLRWTEELERKNTELERFNKLAVGREKRMIELKKKINELHQQLGKPAPFKTDFTSLNDSVGIKHG
jgi:PAS domain S-box-containing protein